MSCTCRPAREFSDPRSGSVAGAVERAPGSARTTGGGFWGGRFCCAHTGALAAETHANPTLSAVLSAARTTPDFVLSPDGVRLPTRCLIGCALLMISLHLRTAAPASLSATAGRTLIILAGTRPCP